MQVLLNPLPSTYNGTYGVWANRTPAIWPSEKPNVGWYLRKWTKWIIRIKRCRREKLSHNRAWSRNWWMILCTLSAIASVPVWTKGLSVCGPPSIIFGRSFTGSFPPPWALVVPLLTQEMSWVPWAAAETKLSWNGVGNVKTNLGPGRGVIRFQGRWNNPPKKLGSVKRKGGPSSPPFLNLVRFRLRGRFSPVVSKIHPKL